MDSATDGDVLEEEFLLELAVAERLAEGPGQAKPVEEVAHDLGLASELGLEEA